MAEANQIQAKVYVPGRERRPGLQRQLTFEIISEWIKLQELDEYTTKGLLELASRYPTQAYPSFRKNFNLMIQRVRAKRKLEQDQQENKEEPVNEEWNFKTMEEAHDESVRCDKERESLRELADRNPTSGAVENQVSNAEQVLREDQHGNND